MKNQDFDEYAKTKTFNFAIADTWKSTLADIVKRTDRPAEDLTILDVGCGDGKYFSYLLGLGLSVDNIHGIEVSRLRIERCHAIGWKNAVHVENGSALPYGEGVFDVVNLMEVIEHIPPQSIESVLGEIHRVLRPKGTLIISTPNYPIKRFYDFYDALAYRKWLRLRDDPTHVAFYNHARLHAVVNPYFNRIEERCYKTGFLYRRLFRSRFTMHKMLFVCSEKRVPVTGARRLP